jgi:hypothetical protein
MIHRREAGADVGSEGGVCGSGMFDAVVVTSRR